MNWWASHNLFCSFKSLFDITIKTIKSYLSDRISNRFNSYIPQYHSSEWRSTSFWFHYQSNNNHYFVSISYSLYNPNQPFIFHNSFYTVQKKSNSLPFPIGSSICVSTHPPIKYHKLIHERITIFLQNDRILRDSRFSSASSFREKSLFVPFLFILLYTFISYSLNSTHKTMGNVLDCGASVSLPFWAKPSFCRCPNLLKSKMSQNWPTQTHSLP